MKLFKQTEHQDGILNCFGPLTVYQNQSCCASLNVVASCFPVVVVVELRRKWKRHIDAVLSVVYNAKHLGELTKL